MNCFNHPETNAVGNCQTCGKYLCKECSIYFNGPPVCVDCVDALEHKNVGKVKRNIIISVILLIVALAMGISDYGGMIGTADTGYALKSILSMTVFFTGLPWGISYFRIKFFPSNNQAASQADVYDAAYSANSGSYFFGKMIGWILLLLLAGITGFFIMIYSPNCQIKRDSSSWSMCSVIHSMGVL